MLSYRSKLTLLLGASLLALTVLFVVAFGKLYHRSLKEGMQQRLLAVAVSAAAMLDVEAHERVSGPEHMAKASYKAMAQRFDRLLATTPALKRVYSVRPEGGKGDAAVWRFVVDGSPAGTRIDGVEGDFSPTGRVFDKLPRSAKRAFKAKKPVVDSKPALDGRALVISAYAPLVDKAGQAVGIVGVGMSAEALQASTWAFWLLALGLLAGALVVAALVATAAAQEHMQPFDELRAAAERVAGGDLARPLVERDGELKAVYGAFNGMMQSIRRAQELIRQQADREPRLELAATAQSQLLSAKQIDHPAVRLFHYSRTADSTGGDWAHYHVCAGRWLYMLCGDVVGHGAASAMVSAAVAGCFEGVKLDIDAGVKTPAVGSHGSTLARRGAVFGVGELMRHLHKVVLSSGHGRFPMTMFALVLDLETGLAEYACAGHPSARIVRLGPRGDSAAPRGNTIRLLRGRTGFIGFDGELSLDIRTERLGPGDAIVLFSDGLMKRCDPAGRFYGSGRIDRLLREYPPSEAGSLGAALIKDVASFAQDSEAHDDVSLMVAHFNGPADEETLEALEEKRQHAA
jgi:serine phosphatase RsbU (regulator of sigma subunit)